MEAFDYIIMAVGALLIVIGLALFALGKRESANSNQVEGFGIKVNVSNPSIILVVLGIGLLLAPRLLPGPGTQPASSPPVAVETIEPTTTVPQSTAEPEQKPVTTTTAPTQAPVETPTQQPVTQPPQQTVATAPPASPPPSMPSVFLPTGTWQMSGYEVDGVDLSGNAQANIFFQQQSPAEAAWVANIALVDMWGNFANYQYQGVVSGDGSGYWIMITASNDPDFFAQGAAPLDLRMEDGGVLHMEYNYGGSHFLLHWFQ